MITRTRRLDNAYAAALRSYRSDDPISSRLLLDAIEGRARRMRAEALREMLGGALRWIWHSITGITAAAEPVARRERLAS